MYTASFGPPILAGQARELVFDSPAPFNVYGRKLGGFVLILINSWFHLLYFTNNYDTNNIIKEHITPICAIRLPHANLLTFHIELNISYHNK